MATILMIDDDENIQSYLLKVLEKDYSVRPARNGMDGIRAHQQELVELGFCDLFMDRKGELETTRLALV
jgi:DNA-binding NtrC family response regulator